MHLIQIRPFNFVKWSKFFKSDENAGWNKSAGRNFFQKIIKVQDGIRLCRLEFSEKLISCAACLLDTLEYTMDSVYHLILIILSNCNLNKLGLKLE